MSFVVTWTPDAANDIDKVWNLANAHGQQAIIDAIVAIEQTLRAESTIAGESREAPLSRILTIPPVTVRYLVNLERNWVRVFAAQVYRRK